MNGSDSPLSSYGSMTTKAYLHLYEITEEDLKRIQDFGALVLPRFSEYLDAFYTWLEKLPAFDEHFSDPERLARVKREQEVYWNDFFKGHVNDDYIQRRRIVGETHARIGLSLDTYFAAMNLSMVVMTDRMYDGSLDVEDYAAAVRAVTKLMHLDTAIVAETFSRLMNQTILDQSHALMEMSTPVTSIWNQILMVPLVGVLDSKRSYDLMNAMLTKIAETHSRVIILDISGVAVVDTAVANHLIQITKATRLMGCACIFSGISPVIAQTIVELGIEIKDVDTTATLKDALSIALKKTGVDIREL